MSEKVSKHCWATPKCGISTSIKYLNKNKDIDYKFIITRNPYSRVVSFYINKVVFQGNPPSDTKRYYNEEILIPHILISDTSISFLEFIEKLSKMNIINIERHLKPQYVGVENITFDKIVKIENFKDDIKDVCDILDIDYDCIRNVNKFPKNDKITEKVYNYKTEWFRINGCPKNWELFYNDKLKNIVYNLYEEDFKMFDYKK